MRATRMGTLTVALMMSGAGLAHAHTMPGDPGDDLQQICLGQADFLPHDVEVGNLNTITPMTIRMPNWAQGQADCMDYAWLHGYFDYSAGVRPQWAGPAITSSAWDCNHSSMEYVVYRRDFWHPWSKAGGGVMYGKLVNGVCTYSVNNFPQQPGTDSMTMSTSGFPVEFLVGTRSWNHNDPALAHPGTYCGALNCYWETILKVNGL